MKNSNALPKIILYGQEGGARSYIGVLLLQLLREKTGVHVSKAVDYVGGASGAHIFLNALITPKISHPQSPRYSEAEVASLFRQALPNIFEKGKLRHIFGKINNDLPLFPDNAAVRQRLRSRYFHDQSILEDCLKRLFGEETLVKDTIIPSIIPMREFAGENWRASKLKDVEGQEINFEDLPLYKAVMASCMAPTAYDSYQFHYNGRDFDMIDGAMFEKPAFVTNIVQSNEPDSDVYLIYLGTGVEPIRHSVDRYRNSNHHGLFQFKDGTPLLASEFMDAATKASDSSLKHRLKDRLHSVNFDLTDYFPKGQVPFIDEASPEVLEKYEAIASDVFEKNMATFDSIARLFEYRANLLEVQPNDERSFSRFIQGLSNLISSAITPPKNRRKLVA